MGAVEVKGADLTGADLREADLKGANLQRATANERTDWPKGFNPVAAGVIIENVAPFTPAGSAPEPLPAEPQVSVADELGKLADLRDRGILSEDDWNNPSIERRTNPVARLFKAFGRSSKSRR